MDGARARWCGTEAKFVTAFGKSNKLVYGAEYVNNLQQDQFKFDVSPAVVYSDIHAHGSRWGVYLQDEATLAEGWVLDAGVRHDHLARGLSSTNPRVAFIWNPRPAMALKLIYGSAFRAPNADDMFYSLPGTQAPNPNLAPERVKNDELVYEQVIERSLRVSATAFTSKIAHLIGFAIAQEGLTWQLRFTYKF